MKKIYQYATIVFTYLLMSNSGYAASNFHIPIDFPIPGSACQAKDEAALSGGSLIRTTFGIENTGEKDINIYCPVNTEINSVLHRFTVSARGHRNDNPLECYVAFNAYQLRDYRHLKNRASGYLSASVETKLFGWHPVTIKCTLKPGQKVIHIMTYIDTE